MAPDAQITRQRGVLLRDGQGSVEKWVAGSVGHHRAAPGIVRGMLSEVSVTVFAHGWWAQVQAQLSRLGTGEVEGIGFDCSAILRGDLARIRLLCVARFEQAEPQQGDQATEQPAMPKPFARGWSPFGVVQLPPVPNQCASLGPTLCMVSAGQCWNATASMAPKPRLNGTWKQVGRLVH